VRARNGWRDRGSSQAPWLVEFPSMLAHAKRPVLRAPPRLPSRARRAKPSHGRIARAGRERQDEVEAAACSAATTWVVVGGGVMGLMTAVHLRLLGAGSVVLLERRYLGPAKRQVGRHSPAALLARADHPHGARQPAGVRDLPRAHRPRHRLSAARDAVRASRDRAPDSRGQRPAAEAGGRASRHPRLRGPAGVEPRGRFET